MKKELSMAPSTLVGQNRAFLMGISILAVLCVHQSWIPHSWLLNFNRLVVGPVFLAVFFYVSGFGLSFSLRKHTLRAYYLRRFVRLLPVCVVCGIIKILLDNYGPACIQDSSTTSASSLHTEWWTVLGLDLWFIRCIIILYLVAPLLFQAVRRWGEAVFWASIPVSLVFVWLLSGYPIAFQPFLYLPIFVSGMAFGLGKFRLRKVGALLSVVLFLVYSALILASQFQLIGFSHDLADNFCIYIFVPYWTWLWAWVGSKLKSWHCDRPFVWMGGCTLELYLLHEFIYHCVFNGLEPGREWHFLVALALSFLTAFLVNKAVAFYNHSIVAISHPRSPQS